MLRGMKLHGLGLLLLIPLLVAACGSDGSNVDGGDAPPAFPGPANLPPTTPVGEDLDSLVGMPSIFKEYGVLFAKEGEWQKELAVKPWSAYWYPIRSRALFDGPDAEKSPLEKYDDYVKEAHQAQASAAQYEEKTLHKPAAEEWEGHCHAWALASLLYPEPKKPVKRGSVTFSVSDQKALLMKTFEETVVRSFGERFIDYTRSDWNNIQPHLFHQFVMGELIERGRPFVMNKRPGMEVWSVPVYKAILKIEKDRQNPNVYHAQAWLVGAGLQTSPSDSLETVTEVSHFTYDLFTLPDIFGRDRVYAGKWTGLSVDMHPSILTVLPDRNAQRKSRNIEVKNDWVAEIVE